MLTSSMEQRASLVEEKIGLLQKLFECPICLELMKNPVSTRCDHKFCRHCLLETLGKKLTAPCPLCKDPFTKRSLQPLVWWKQIVNKVGELVGAFQLDTGAVFSPRHGSHLDSSQLSGSPGGVAPRVSAPRDVALSHHRPDLHPTVTVSPPAAASQLHKEGSKKRQQDKAESDITILEDDTAMFGRHNPLVKSHVNISSSFPLRRTKRQKKMVAPPDGEGQENWHVDEPVVWPVTGEPSLSPVSSEAAIARREQVQNTEQTAGTVDEVLDIKTIPSIPHNSTRRTSDPGLRRKSPRLLNRRSADQIKRLGPQMGIIPMRDQRGDGRHMRDHHGDGDHVQDILSYLAEASLGKDITSTGYGGNDEANMEKCSTMLDAGHREHSRDSVSTAVEQEAKNKEAQTSRVTTLKALSIDSSLITSRVEVTGQGQVITGRVEVTGQGEAHGLSVQSPPILDIPAVCIGNISESREVEMEPEAMRCLEFMAIETSRTRKTRSHNVKSQVTSVTLKSAMKRKCKPPRTASEETEVRFTRSRSRETESKAPVRNQEVIASETAQGGAGCPINRQSGANKVQTWLQNLPESVSSLESPGINARAAMEIGNSSTASNSHPLPAKRQTHRGDDRNHVAQDEVDLTRDSYSEVSSLKDKTTAANQYVKSTRNHRNVDVVVVSHGDSDDEAEIRCTTDAAKRTNHKFSGRKKQNKIFKSRSSIVLGSPLRHGVLSPRRAPGMPQSDDPYTFKGSQSTPKAKVKGRHKGRQQQTTKKPKPTKAPLAVITDEEGETLVSDQGTPAASKCTELRQPEIIVFEDPEDVDMGRSKLSKDVVRHTDIELSSDAGHSGSDGVRGRKLSRREQERLQQEQVWNQVAMKGMVDQLSQAEEFDLLLSQQFRDMETSARKKDYTRATKDNGRRTKLNSTRSSGKHTIKNTKEDLSDTSKTKSSCESSSRTCRIQNLKDVEEMHASPAEKEGQEQTQVAPTGRDGGLGKVSTSLVEESMNAVLGTNKSSDVGPSWEPALEVLPPGGELRQSERLLLDKCTRGVSTKDQKEKVAHLLTLHTSPQCEPEIPGQERDNLGGLRDNEESRSYLKQSPVTLRTEEDHQSKPADGITGKPITQWKRNAVDANEAWSSVRLMSKDIGPKTKKLKFTKEKTVKKDQFHLKRCPLVVGIEPTDTEEGLVIVDGSTHDAGVSGAAGHAGSDLDSSATEELDLSPEHTSYEPADLEIQPEDIKKQILQSQKSISESTSRASHVPHDARLVNDSNRSSYDLSCIPNTFSASAVKASESDQQAEHAVRSQKSGNWDIKKVQHPAGACMRKEEAFVAKQTGVSQVEEEFQREEAARYEKQGSIKLKNEDRPHRPDEAGEKPSTKTKRQRLSRTQTRRSTHSDSDQEEQHGQRTPKVKRFSRKTFSLGGSPLVPCKQGKAGPVLESLDVAVMEAAQLMESTMSSGSDDEDAETAVYLNYCGVKDEDEQSDAGDEGMQWDLEERVNEANKEAHELKDEVREHTEEVERVIHEFEGIVDEVDKVDEKAPELKDKVLEHTGEVERVKVDEIDEKAPELKDKVHEKESQFINEFGEEGQTVSQKGQLSPDHKCKQVSLNQATLVDGESPEAQATEVEECVHPVKEHGGGVSVSKLPDLHEMSGTQMVPPSMSPRERTSSKTKQKRCTDELHSVRILMDKAQNSLAEVDGNEEHMLSESRSCIEESWQQANSQRLTKEPLTPTSNVSMQDVQKRMPCYGEQNSTPLPALTTTMLKQQHEGSATVRYSSAETASDVVAATDGASADISLPFNLPVHQNSKRHRRPSKKSLERHTQGSSQHHVGSPEEEVPRVVDEVDHNKADLEESNANMVSALAMSIASQVINEGLGPESEKLLIQIAPETGSMESQNSVSLLQQQPGIQLVRQGISSRHEVNQAGSLHCISRVSPNSHQSLSDTQVSGSESMTKKCAMLSDSDSDARNEQGNAMGSRHHSRGVRAVRGLARKMGLTESPGTVGSQSSAQKSMTQESESMLQAVKPAQPVRPLRSADPNMTTVSPGSVPPQLKDDKYRRKGRHKIYEHMGEKPVVDTTERASEQSLKESPEEQAGEAHLPRSQRRLKFRKRLSLERSQGLAARTPSRSEHSPVSRGKLAPVKPDESRAPKGSNENSLGSVEEEMERVVAAGVRQKEVNGDVSDEASDLIPPTPPVKLISPTSVIARVSPAPRSMCRVSPQSTSTTKQLMHQQQLVEPSQRRKSPRVFAANKVYDRDRIAWLDSDQSAGLLTWKQTGLDGTKQGITQEVSNELVQNNRKMTKFMATNASHLATKGKMPSERKAPNSSDEGPGELQAERKAPNSSDEGPGELQAGEKELFTPPKKPTTAVIHALPTTQSQPVIVDDRDLEGTQELNKVLANVHQDIRRSAGKSRDSRRASADAVDSDAEPAAGVVMVMEEGEGAALTNLETEQQLECSSLSSDQESVVAVSKLRRKTVPVIEESEDTDETDGGDQEEHTEEEEEEEEEEQEAESLVSRTLNVTSSSAISTPNREDDTQKLKLEVVDIQDEIAQLEAMIAANTTVLAHSAPPQAQRTAESDTEAEESSLGEDEQMRMLIVDEDSVDLFGESDGDDEGALANRSPDNRATGQSSGGKAGHGGSTGGFSICSSGREDWLKNAKQKSNTLPPSEQHHSVESSVSMVTVGKGDSIDQCMDVMDNAEACVGDPIDQCMDVKELSPDSEVEEQHEMPLRAPSGDELSQTPLSPSPPPPLYPGGFKSPESIRVPAELRGIQEVYAGSISNERSTHGEELPSSSRARKRRHHRLHQSPTSQSKPSQRKYPKTKTTTRKIIPSSFSENQEDHSNDLLETADGSPSQSSAGSGIVLRERNSADTDLSDADDLTKQDRVLSVGTESDTDEDEDDEASLGLEFPQHPNWSLVATGVDKMTHQPFISRFVGLTGARFQQKFDANTSHVLVKPAAAGSLRCQRTLKYFQGVAHRRWVVSVDWIVDSITRNKLLPMKHYEIEGDTIEADEHYAPRRSRKTTAPLLAKYEICCLGQFVDLTKDNLVDLAQASGASTVHHPTLFNFDPALTRVVVVDAAQAHTIPSLHKLQLKCKSSVVTKEWLLDCISRYSLEELDHYLVLQQKPHHT